MGKELYFFFSSRRRHTRFSRDWSSDVCSSDLSHHTSDEWTVHMEPSGRDHRHHGSEHAAVAKAIEHGRLRGPAGSADTATECETDRHGGSGKSLEALPGEILRSEREALRGEAAR